MLLPLPSTFLSARPASWISGLLLALVVSAPIPVRAVENDPTLWLTALGQTALPAELSGALLVQTRFFDDMSSLERFLVNPFLSLPIGPGLAAAGGYDAHVIRRPRVRLEHRTWQQLTYRHELSLVKVHHRLRLEQRYLEGEDGTANRLRWWLEGQIPIETTPWVFVLRNEAFFDLDAKREGPTEAGFGETRLFGGFDRSFDNGLGVEVGYQLQYVDRRRREDLAIHIVSIMLRYAR